MIKAVIFDCFDVLTSDGWLAFCEMHLRDDDKLEKASVANRRVDAGLITYDDFIKKVADLADLGVSETLAIIEENRVNLVIFDYIKNNLAGKYKIGLLSNAGANWLDRLFTPDQNELFDEVVLSCELGVVKPDPLMYQTISNKLGVLPEECLFIDDQPRFVEGAKQVGMQAFVFNDTETTITKIKEILNA